MTPTQREEYLRGAARAAAKWWADRLRDGAGIGDNGALDANSIAAAGFTLLIRARHQPTEDNCARFERELERAICLLVSTEDYRCYRDCPGFDDGGSCLVLSVDYHPCDVLHGALIEAGIHASVASTAALPLKTAMWVSARMVRVAHGYGAPQQEIWGPAWGSSIAEHRATSRYRSDQAAQEIEACRASGWKWQTREWVGCVPAPMHVQETEGP